MRPRFLSSRRRVLVALAVLVGVGALWAAHVFLAEKAAAPEDARIFPLSVSGAEGATDADAAPEAQLERIFADIEAMRLSAALQRAENLVQRYPNYRLAHLIKGDLLLARARALENFGAARDAPPERIADLRAEAIVRLEGYRNKPKDNDVPRYLLQMEERQRHAIVIDTRKSRLYLYQNDQGQPRLAADYYITQGKLGAGKQVQGDRRTPVGVYHVTAHIPREKLPELYGHGAFPINYPNEWDRRQGRSGSGIWLHGTPSDTYSRPPQASDGCVVLTNPDFDALGKNVQIGLTPVIISDAVEWLSPEDWRRERAELQQRIDAWRVDWESRDTERYLAHYARDFRNRQHDFQSFAAQKRAVNQGKRWITVKLENLSIFRSPGAENLALVTFDQAYASNNLTHSMKKRQYWQRENGQWKIVYEGDA
ncbi:MAG: L,D-transpeptidase family protein [Zoogloeaceae bacterium]|jgi:murein L,D-transpeptidase YafK|nr:L,D-transpeptidase family protein [Zoogloeaceae bacterium]